MRAECLALAAPPTASLGRKLARRQGLNAHKRQRGRRFTRLPLGICALLAAYEAPNGHREQSKQ